METNLTKKMLLDNLAKYRTEGNFYNITDFEFWKTLTYLYSEIDFYVAHGICNSFLLEDIISKYSSK